MTTADDVRRVGLALPRAYEREIRGRWKLKVGQLVFVAFSRDELAMGFGFPRAERDGLVASDPGDLLPASDLGPALPVGVCAPAPARVPGDARAGHRRVADVRPEDAARAARAPAPTAALWAAIEAGEWGEVRSRLHPRVTWRDGDLTMDGRSDVLDHLRNHPTPKPPTDVEVRDGQVRSWTR